MALRKSRNAATRLTRDALQVSLASLLGADAGEKHSYTIGYKKNDEVFYLKGDADRFPLVVHPDWLQSLQTDPIAGVELAPKLYRNSNLYGYPRLFGKEKSPTGLAIDVRDVETLHAVLTRIGVNLSVAYQSAVSREENTPALDRTTEREALLAARIGQGLFRLRTEVIWGGCCAVTGVALREALRASHIKPWSVCSDKERLDGENGLLLVATLDALFDEGLISFADSGELVAKEEVRSAVPPILETQSARLRGEGLSEGQKCYLAYHRHQFGF